MMEFSHVGYPTDKKHENERWVEKTRVWVSNYFDHPYKVEWLRYAPDSPVTGPVRERPHVAFRVDSLEQASRGLKVLLEPFQAAPTRRVGFYEYADGSVVELIEDSAPR